MNLNPETEPKVIKIKKPNSLLNVLMFLVLVAAISIMAFAAYLKNSGYDFKSLSVKDGIDFINNKNRKAANTPSAEIAFSQDGSVDFKYYRGYTVILSQDGIKWYDKNGELLQEKPLTLTRPVLRISGKYMAVVDISGRDIYFYRDKTQLWARKLDNQIINADLSDDGDCAVVTQSKEYKAIVQVIDVNGADKYTKRCAEDIVLGAKSIHNGQDVLINKVLTDSVKTGTQFEFNNIYDKNPFAAINVTDGLLPIVMSQGENEIAVGQNLVLFMDGEGKEVWRKTADSIFCVAPDGGRYIILAGKFTDSAGTVKQQVVALNSKGEVVYSFDQPENVSGMHLYGDRLALRTQRSVYLYTLKGKKLGQYTSRNEIKDAYLISSNEVLVISGGNISTVEIN